MSSINDPAFTPVLVGRVDQVRADQLDEPCVQVTCQCPALCWAHKNTIAQLTGRPIKFFCTLCVPAELSASIRRAAEHLRADPTRDPSRPSPVLISPDTAIILPQGKESK